MVRKDAHRLYEFLHQDPPLLLLCSAPDRLDVEISQKRRYLIESGFEFVPYTVLGLLF
jgi:hypothetical protein